MHKKTPDDGIPLVGNDRYEGFCADLAVRVAEAVDFEFEIRLVKDEKYGARMEGGEWNGMVGELTKRVSHVESLPVDRRCTSGCTYGIRISWTTFTSQFNFRVANLPS